MPALGKALDWSDDQLDLLSEVTPADLERARSWWHDRSPARYRFLLDAEPEIDEEIDVSGTPSQ